MLLSRACSMANRRFLLAQQHQLQRATFASVGEKLPSVDLHLGFPPKKYNLAEFCKNKEVLLVGLPGAFTPT